MVPSEPDQYLTITFTHPTNVSDLSIDAEASSDLKNWQPAILHSTIYSGNGTATSTYRNVNPVSTNSRRFLRARFEVPAP